jgi:tRNA (guanine37-N1)-methyltransferase
MRFDIITLFPELFAPFLSAGVTRRAFEADGAGQKLVDVRFWNPRDFAQGNYRRVDDRPFGGGPGMVMMAEPLALCLAVIRADRGEGEQAQGELARASELSPVILFSPIGQALNHAQAQRWAASSGAVLLCGRYEGVDQRFIDRFVTHQISLGDFVLSGGEIPAMALLDAVARLQPGVLQDDQSHVQDSFNPAVKGLLDCPHYTRPEVWRGQSVPEVLLSGNHAAIEHWRGQQRQAITQAHRPDLLAAPGVAVGSLPKQQ